MDNRRVIKSYKSRVQSQSSPYPTGLVSKFKRFFSGSSSTNANDGQTSFTYPEPKLINNESKTNVSQKFNRSHISNNVSVNNGSAVPNSNISIPGSFESPNKIISTFFKEKGDEPLTQIEYEGIVSLINKSKSNESFVGNSNHASFINSKDILQDEKSLLSKPINANEKSFINSKSLRIPTSRKHSISSDIYNTPYNQKTLKVNNSAVFSTPDYTPAYHTIGNTTMPSVKRVYQFSGLPSPYRTRIRPPSAISRKPNGNTTIGSITTISETPSTKRPRSNTANTLLSILDNKSDTKQDKTNNDIASFTNPYKPNNKKKKSTITANDIKNTMSFDTSEKLPEKSKDDRNGSIKCEDKTKDEPTKEANEAIEEKEEKEEKEVKNPENYNEQKVGVTNKPDTNTKFSSSGSSSTNFNFGPITIPNDSKTKGSDVPKALDTPKNTSTNSNTSLGLGDSSLQSKVTFEFPEVKITLVKLDQKQVDSYIPLFRF